MNNATRLHYLQAMGIDVWVPKSKAQVAASGSFVEPEQTKPVLESTEVWRTLEQQVASCKDCELCHTRTHTVFGAGDSNAHWMIIGEAPGQHEDLSGQPFVGPAGKLLTEMIRAIGLARQSVYITNAIKCRPPANRNPKIEELASCEQYLQRQIELVQPKIVLAVGVVAAQALLKTDKPLANLRGVVHQTNGIPLLVTYHPSHLLRSLSKKREAWEDLQLANNSYQKTQ